MNESKIYEMKWIGYDKRESIPITEEEFSLYPSEFAEQLRKAEIENVKKNGPKPENMIMEQ